MNPFRKKSDREVVEELRREQRWRRPLGVAFIALGLLLTPLFLWKAEWTRRKVLEIADAADRPGTQPDLCHNSALLAYTEGFVTGSSTGLGLLSGVTALVGGARLLFGGRKARLLLQCFDDRKPQPEDGL